MASQHDKWLEHSMKPSTRPATARGVEAIPYQGRVGYLLGAIAI